jgi:hypothetical protein
MAVSLMGSIPKQRQICLRPCSHIGSVDPCDLLVEQPQEGLMTSVSVVEPSHFSGNPIDLVEEIVIANDWAHDRASEEELVVEISGRWCDYRLYFVWQEEISALHFSCGFDMKVSRGRRSAVYELLALANEKLWLGHFDLSAEENSPAFRHAVLLRGVSAASAEQVEDLVDIALSECERFYPAFQFVVWGGKSPAQAIASAMIDPVGEA